MLTVPESVAKLVSQIGTGRCKTTLSDLISLLATDKELGTLGQVAQVRDFLDSLNVEVIPPLDKGEVDTIRLIRFQHESDSNDYDHLINALGSDESECVEFKSTFRVDLKRLTQTGQTVEQCVSDDVVLASLKTVAAFLNSDGGRLYIGVSDDKQIVGLNYDLQLTDTLNLDKFEQHIRSQLQGKFKDGKMINDYVSLAFIEHESRQVALIKVLPRNALSFLKKGDQHLLFRRQGIRTLQIDISEMEEYLSKRWDTALLSN